MLVNVVVQVLRLLWQGNRGIDPAMCSRRLVLAIGVAWCPEQDV